MCMIAYRPYSGDKRGGNIPHRVIDTAIGRHPDGFGLAWREWTDDGPVLRHEKFGPGQRKAFRKALKRVDRSPVEYVAHFRFATHGPKAAPWSHPYEYTDPAGERVLVFHNGVISIATGPQESDTEVFVRDVLAHLQPRWWTDLGIVRLVSLAIDWSRLVIMTATETVNLQEKAGEWDGGLWYSSNHRPSVYTSSTTYGGGWKPTAASTTWTRAQVKSAEESAKVLGLIGDDDRPLLPVTAADGFYAEARWRHGGHTLTAMEDIDRSTDGDYEDALMCDTCYTLGTLYIIDGQSYIDMAHRVPVDAPEDADEEERQRAIIALS